MFVIISIALASPPWGLVPKPKEPSNDSTEKNETLVEKEKEHETGTVAPMATPVAEPVIPEEKEEKKEEEKDSAGHIFECMNQFN